MEEIIFDNKGIHKQKLLNIELKNNDLSDSQIKSVIDDSIESQLVSDVPIALSLSVE